MGRMNGYRTVDDFWGEHAFPDLYYLLKSLSHSPSIFNSLHPSAACTPPTHTATAVIVVAFVNIGGTLSQTRMDTLTTSMVLSFTSFIDVSFRCVAGTLRQCVKGLHSAERYF